MTEETLSGVKCTSRRIRILSLILALCFLTGCGKTSYELAYSAGGVFAPTRYGVEVSRSRAVSFASSLCVAEGDVIPPDMEEINAGAAGLFDLKNKEVLYAKGVHEKMYPASLTKVMTAIVALENGSLDQVLEATDKVKITESGAATAKLKAGDSMTLDQALHILLLASANDVANLIAEGVGGSIENFIAMMNEKAAELGATNTHFTNAHGLTDVDHYTTAYDMYLIFNEAIKYDVFNQIINMNSYQTTYYDRAANPIQFNSSTTNRFFKGQVTPPENVTILGGKTGTTNAAGHCLILHVKDNKGNSYIAVVMRCLNSDVLYAEMVNLLEEINN
ncbi:MAG: D-alanyl-D-alanine carboxypeptidase [Lachnospiraceae bacterium]|nr:D-alanyl-D-alanine carboxypeptidase [Lachnospiraceae bacterium]MBP5264028.1 D-alanyl-D-alanine carboxypeptidase [Lachnospiraceae bacterium]